MRKWTETSGKAEPRTQLSRGSWAVALRASWRRGHLHCLSQGLKDWQERLGCGYHSLGSNNFRKVLPRSRPLVPQGSGPARALNTPMQPRIAPIVLACSWGTVEDAEGRPVLEQEDVFPIW